MRISDHRYNRDRLRYDLALRMMRHEARTCTIQSLTGLTEDRIRKLYRGYFSQPPAGVRVRRHRGQSPRQPAVFLQSAAMNFEASTLAALFCAIGVLPAGNDDPPRDIAPTLDQAEAFCRAFESYTTLHAPSRLSFEYAWFLLVALLKKQDLRLSKCAQCGRVYVDEIAYLTAPNCGCSRRQGVPQPRHSRLPQRLVQSFNRRTRRK